MTVTINPTSYDFGNQNVNTTRMTTFTVTNSDKDNAAALTCTGTGMSCTPTSIAAGATTTVIVTFAPTATGAIAGALQDSSTPSVQASLAGTGVVLDDIQEGDATRFRVDVPTPSVTMTLGQGVQNVTYDGFGLTAPNDTVFLNAGKSLWAQSAGDLTLQSNASNIASLAENDSLTCAKGNASLVGGGGVFIGAGLSLSPSAADFVDTMPHQRGSSSLKGTTIAAGCFTGLDIIIGVAMLKRSVHHARQLKWYGLPGAEKATSAITGAGVMAAVAGTVMSALDAASQGDGRSPNIPGVTIFGETGFLMGTPAFGSIYAIAGVSVASLYTSVLGLDTEVLGMRTASLASYCDTTVEASTKVQIKSGEKIDIDAQKKISLRAGDQILAPKTSDITMSADEINISGPPRLPGVPSDDTVKISPQSMSVAHHKKFKVEVKDVSLVMSPDYFTLSSDEMTFNVQGDTKKLQLAHPKTISLKAGAATLEMANGNATINGQRILLG